MLIRSALPEDALAVAEVHVRSWQAAYRDLLPREYLDRLRPEDRASRYDFGAIDPGKPSTLVAVREEVVLGFVTVMPARDSDARGKGEVCALYVDPQWWDQGVGRALMQAGRARLGMLGFRDAILWVLAGNTRAGRFYAHDGWRPDGGRRAASVWGLTVDEVRHGRRLAAPELNASAGSSELASP